MIDALFSSELDGAELALMNLSFAVPAMTEDEKARALPRLSTGGFKMDPRHVRYLYLYDSFRDRSHALTALIEKAATRGGYSGSRSMSGYFHDAAKLGGYEFVHELVGDVADNAKQPTNFYCSACSLAIISDGLVGTPLVDAVRTNRLIDVSYQGGRYTLALQESSGE